LRYGFRKFVYISAKGAGGAFGAASGSPWVPPPFLPREEEKGGEGERKGRGRSRPNKPKIASLRRSILKIVNAI